MQSERLVTLMLSFILMFLSSGNSATASIFLLLVRRGYVEQRKVLHPEHFLIYMLYGSQVRRIPASEQMRVCGKSISRINQFHKLFQKNQSYGKRRIKQNTRIAQIMVKR
jgi:hypothetical protein